MADGISKVHTDILAFNRILHQVSGGTIFVLSSRVISWSELRVIHHVNLVRVVFVLCSTVLRHYINVEYLVTSTSRHLTRYRLLKHLLWISLNVLLGHGSLIEVIGLTEFFKCGAFILIRFFAMQAFDSGASTET